MVLIRLLGPVDLVDDAGNVHGSPSAIRRTLLALFALHPGRVLSAEWLLDHVWNGDVPESGRRALRFHISTLRRELGALDIVETCPGGYRLRVAPEEVDTCVVESLGRAARDETDDGRASQLCLEGLAMWRGEPFIDASPTSDLTDEAERLEELRLTLTELGFQRRFKAGEGAELIAELIRLTADHPLREALWLVLIAAQYRVGRQADALRSYDTVRSILVETLGVEPSEELQELHRRVLDHDPTLGAAPGRPSVLMLWDVAGATGLLVRRGQAGINMLANASEAVAAIARGNGGRVTTSQGEGDGAVVLFASVRDAVATAIEVNERIAQRAWPDGELVAVRSAIHIGDVTVTAAGVFGSEVHRCARLRALADGGEVFLSDAAVATVGLQSLPDGSSAVDEGLVLVPGFAETEAEHVWRLVHPALQARQRALQLAVLSPPSPPVWRTSFVGRAEDVASVGARLDARRLVTLVGPAGVGKTRLAAAVAAAASGRACFVDLTLATKPDEVDALVADVVGSNRESAPRKGIEAALGAAPALLVLDNCEHVLDAVASLVEFVLTASGGSSVLATSRSALRVADEDLFVVAPLQTAVGGDATQLFIDRAGVALGALSTDVRVLDQIGAVTALLDGVPLAIELAAARVTAFSVGEILAMLQHDMAGLGDARRRGPDRQRSVRSAIGWSLRMLSHDERRLLGRLAMLPGSFRLGAAIAVAGRGEDRVLVEAMQAFVDQSLIAAQHRTGPTRYRMLEMIRSIAQDEIGATERDEVLDRLLAHCLDQVSGLAGPVAPEVGFEEEARLDAALFSTSIEHALATNQIESGLQLVYDLFTPWHTRTQRSTLDRWTSDLVAKTSAPSSLRAMVLRRQAILADEDEGDAERARQLLEAAAADASVLNNRALLGRIQSNLAFVIDPGPKDRRFEQLLCEAITLLDECGDSYVSEPLTWLANLYARRGRFDQTEELLNRAEAVNPPWFVLIKIEMQRAMCALLAGRVELVGAPAARALEMAEQSGDPEWIAQAGGVAATGALARGEIALAEQLWIRLVALARENDLSTRIDSLGELAVVSALQGDLSVARSCRDELRSHLPGTQWTKIERALARLACSFVDLADGDADMAAEASAEVLADAERHNMPLIRALSLELIAASIAGTDPQRARELLAEADQERIAVGATAWPVQPYRDAALRTLEALAPNG